MTSRASEARWRCGSFAAAALAVLGLTMGAAQAADRWSDDAVMAAMATTAPAVVPAVAGKVGFEFCGA